MTTLRSSSKSRFFGKEKVMAISYSRYEGSSGKIRQLYEDFLDAPYAYVRKVPSWVFNPNPAYTRESLNDEFMENEAKAKTIYQCEPGDGFLDSWIKDSKRIKAAMDNEGGEWVLDIPLPSENWRKEPWSEFRWKDEEDNTVILNPFELPIKKRGIKNMKYVFVGDPGLGSERNGGDGYGVCLAHREIITRANGVRYPRVVIDFAFRFTGAMFAEGQVQMTAVEDLVTNLINKYGYDIKIVSFDGWNSATTAQNLARDFKHLNVMNRNLVMTSDYTLLRDLIFGEAQSTSGTGRKEVNGGIQMPYHPILFDELKNLKEDRSFKTPKVDHDKEKSSKDIADTVAKASWILVRQWPFSDIMVSNGQREDKSVYEQQKQQNPGKANPAFIKKLLDMQAQKQLAEKKAAMDKFNSEAFGTGRIKKGRY